MELRSFVRVSMQKGLAAALSIIEIDSACGFMCVKYLLRLWFTTSIGNLLAGRFMALRFIVMAWVELVLLRIFCTVVSGRALVMHMNLMALGLVVAAVIADLIIPDACVVLWWVRSAHV